MMPFRELKNDQRGAVLLVGLLMGFVLVCSLQYVMTVSESILAQERLQAGADALAFQTAVWHARGMNALALLNIAMAMALTIMVIFRVVELVIIIGTILCAVSTAPTAVGPVACIDAGIASMVPVLAWETRVGKYLMKGLKFTSMAEEALAVAVPLIATGPGLRETAAFYRSRGVTEANPYSLSLLPTTIDGVLALTGGPVEPRLGMRMGLAGTGLGAAGALVSSVGPEPEDALMRGMPSLPVEASNFAEVCSRTGEFIASNVQQVSQIPVIAIELLGPDVLPSGVFQGIDDANQILRSAAGMVMGFGPVSVIACEPLISMVNRLISSVVPGPAFLKRKALAWLLKKDGWTTLDATGKIVLQPGAQKVVDFITSDTANKVKPAELWSLAQNGSILLRTWASVGSRAQSRWAFATDPTPAPGQAVASAEYYASCYDIAGRFPAIVSVFLRSCSEDAMWRIGWSARMRRVRAIRSELGVGDTIVNILAEAMQEALPFGNSVFGGHVIEFLTQMDKSPLKSSVDAASEHFDNAFEDLIDPQIDRVVGPAPEPNDIIH